MPKKAALKTQTGRKYKVIDLFCGCGGFSYGFSKVDFDVVLGIDCWEDALKTFKKNHPGAQTFLADLSKIKPASVAAQFKIEKKDIDVIIGGPPCQGFSISGKRQLNDPRNYLYRNFVDFIRYFKPRAFLLENVPNLIAMGQGAVKDEIIKNFSALGYKIAHKVLLASDYGVPQNRKRIVFVGLMNGKEFIFPDTTHKETGRVTAGEAISDLPELSLRDGVSYPSKPLTQYQVVMRSGSNGVYNHEICHHTEKTKKIISMVPDGGNYKNLPQELWGTRKVNIAWTRMNSKKPSFTIDTGHNHHFHYKYNRVPTPRESARIQSFPDSFIFMGKKNDQLKQIGNAVPPLMAEVIAKNLINFI